MADKKISALTAATTPLDGTEVLPIVQSGATVKVANNDLRPKQIQSNATSGVLQVAGPASAATRVMTTPDANFTVARTDAAQTFNANQTVKNTVTFDRYGDGTETLVVSTNSGNGVYNTIGGLNHVWQAASGELARLSTSGGFNLGTDSADAGAGNFRLANGNLVIGTSGQGIDFSATSHPAGMTSELLNDYEEGAWTPVVADASSGGNTGTFTGGGSYTKIGRQVTVRMYLSSVNTTGMTGGNTLFIRGLPFASGNTAQGSFYTYRVGRDLLTVSSCANIGGAGSFFNFALFTTNSATTDKTILVSDIVSGTSEIQTTLTYFV